MSQPVKYKFKCLRCGHEYEDPWARDDDKERACPKPECKSNSQWRLGKA